MSTKRTVTVAEAAAHLLRFRTPVARIERLRRHEQLRERADELAVWLSELGGTANGALIAAIQSGEEEALRADVAPMIKRDSARQVGVRKERGSRTPKLDAWLDLQDLEMKNVDLWASLPEDSGRSVYRDDDKAYEDGRLYAKDGMGKKRGEQRPITYKDFAGRVAAARKRRNPS